MEIGTSEVGTAEPQKLEKGGRKFIMGGSGDVIRSARDLKVYNNAYDLAMEIFKLSKSRPAKEKHSLTDQIRRSSRSVCTNLREAWSKRRYEAYFIQNQKRNKKCPTS